MQVLKGISSDLVVRALPAASKGVSLQAPSLESLALARAEQEIARLTKTIEDTKTAAARAERDAHEKGLEEGRRESAKAADERVRVLETAMVAAHRTWEDALRSVDTLSAELVRGALAKVFEPSEDLAELTIRTIRRKISDLETGSVVAVVVSAADFRGDADRAALKNVVTPLGARLDRSSSLRSGECRVELRVGERSIGPADQWTVLSALLDDLGSGDPAS